MKKILMFILCGFIVLGLTTGCGETEKKENLNQENNSQENDNKVKDNAEELIYQFNKYIQDKDAEKMASLFNEKYTVVANKEYYNRTELTDKFNKVFSDKSYKSYKITDIYKITNEEEYNKYFKGSSSVDYENTVLKMAQVYSDETLIYVVDTEYNDSVSQDVVYITENDGKYVIESTMIWNFMINE